MAWPVPEAARILIYTGNSRLLLPVRQARSQDEGLRPFEPPEAAPPVRMDVVRPEYHNWRVVRDLATDVSKLEVINDSGAQYIKDVDMTISRLAKEWYTYQGDDFNSVRGETLWEREFSRKGWSVRTKCRTVLTSSVNSFFLRAELEAYEDDKRVYSENWDYVIPRDLV